VESLKDYIKNIKKMYLSEMSLWTSILQRDCEDQLRLKDIEFINLKKQLFESQGAERTTYEDKLKGEFNIILA
jgi:hypothetical protein